MTDDDIVIGRIGPARGVRGDVFVEPFTDAPDERFAEGSVLRTEPSGVGPLTVESMANSSGKTVIHFAGIDDRGAAEALRGVRLVIAPSERPALDDPDEFYDTDLVGLAARTVSGDELGPVREVVHAGGADYLVLDVGGTERLVPFVAAIVPTVDVAGGVVEIDPPEGLFEL
ncbi:MAG TPA: ribosome maturation factor RimM [Jatrophihabitantaceae bacterium]|nr:ribosome maturation factor RimM [Jatrophihabitantaceae bacterium]